MNFIETTILVLSLAAILVCALYALTGVVSDIMCRLGHHEYVTTLHYNSITVKKCRNCGHTEAMRRNP